MIKKLIPMQQELFTIDPKGNPLIVVNGGTRSGKTTGIAAVTAHLCDRIPGLEALLGATNIEQAEDTVYQQTIDWLLQEGVPHTPKTFMQKKRIYLPYGGKVTVVGYNNQALFKKKGVPYGFIWIDEAGRLSKRDLGELLGRLSGVGPGMIILSMNSEGPEHYIYQDYIVPGKCQYFFFPIQDNANNLPKDYIDNLKNNSPKFMWQRLGLGLWVAAEGAIFSNFEEDRHVVNEVPDIKEELECGGFDFGYVHPSAFIKLGIADDGCLYAYDEYCQTKADYRLHFENIDARLTNKRMKIYCDHDPQGQNELFRLSKGSLRLFNAPKTEKRKMCLLLYRLLETGRFKIHKSCKKLKNQIQSAVWNPMKEVPLKLEGIEDDVLDALLYVLAGMFKLAKTKKLIEG